MQFKGLDAFKIFKEEENEGSCGICRQISGISSTAVYALVRSWFFLSKARVFLVSSGSWRFWSPWIESLPFGASYYISTWFRRSCCEVAMRYQNAKSKVASGKPKYAKHNCEKWSANVISASQKPHYKPPFVQDQSYFRIDNKKQRFFPQKTTSVEASPPCAPHAPRNTTSYIIRAKNSGGIINTSSPSPSPSTPIPASTGFVTPRYNEGVVEQVNPEWGVDSYGSMKGLLKVRHVNHQANDLDPNLDKCVEILDENLERRLDQDLSRFEMVYPSNNETIGPQILEIRINDQDNQIAFLEEESTILKERVHSMEQELDSLKRRMRVLEGANAFRLGEVCSGEASFA